MAAQPWRRLKLDVKRALDTVKQLAVEASHPPRGRLDASLDRSIVRLQAALGQPGDLVVHRFLVGGRGRKGALLYLDGMADSTVVNRDVLGSLLRPGAAARFTRYEATPFQSGIVLFPSLQASHVTSTTKVEKVLSGILRGQVAVVVDDVPRVWLVDHPGFKARGPEQPTTEQNVLGSKEAFVETLRINTSMLRRRIRSRHLRLVEQRIGSLSPTAVAVVYMENIANTAVVSAVFARIHAIRVDTLNHASELSSYLKDQARTVFPVIEMTERPEVVAREVLNGRVGILVENDPFALVVPATFWDFQQSVDDYTAAAVRANFLRTIRLLALTLAILGSGFYTAFIMVDFAVVPSELALSIVASRQGVPFSAPLEFVLLIVVFEVLREVSLRTPKTMGATIGVVGGIVLGQAMVQSGFVSSPLIVVVSLVGLSIYTTPHVQLASPVRYLAFIGLVLGAQFGLYGLLLGMLAVVAHLNSLTSFDVPYLAPLSPRSRGWYHALIRVSFRDLLMRPRQYRPREAEQAEPYTQPMDHPPTERSS